MLGHLKLLSLPLLLIAGLSISGCDDDSDVEDEVEELFDCVAICSAYDVCVDGDNFNRQRCIDDCESNADASQSFEDQAEDCTDCIETDETCSENRFDCADECVGIVP